MKIGITGPNGRLGSTLVAMGCSPLDCDVTDLVEINSAIRNVRPDVIIHTAAFTSVDTAEQPSRIEDVIRTNLRSLHYLYSSFRGPIIHISTDYVFGGKRGPYREDTKYDDDDLPVNEYGRSKFAAEGFASVCPNITVVRTTGLFGIGKDFLSYLVGKLESNEVIMVADNIFANQTYIPFLARDLIQLAHLEEKPKMIHLASNNIMLRYEFAKRAAEIGGFSGKNIFPQNSNLIAGWIAKRPIYGGLVTKLSQKLGFEPYTVEDGLEHYFESDDSNPLL